MSRPEEVSWYDLLKSGPHARPPLRCRFGFHRWTRLAVTRGMARRMVVARRGCRGCGRVECRKGGAGPWYWYSIGYLPPGELV